MEHGISMASAGLYQLHRALLLTCECAAATQKWQQIQSKQYRIGF
jgi:hypothetical protein